MRIGQGIGKAAMAAALALTWFACGDPDAVEAPPQSEDVQSGVGEAGDTSLPVVAPRAVHQPGTLWDASVRGGALSLPGAEVIGRFEGEIDPFGGESTLRFIPVERKSSALPGMGRTPRTGSQLALEQNLDELGYSAEDCGQVYWTAKWAEEGSAWRFWLDEGAPRTAFWQRLLQGPPDSDGEDALRFCTEFTLRNTSSNTYGDLWLMFDGIALERGYSFVDSVPRRLEGLGDDGTDLEYPPVSDRGMFNYGPLAPSEEVSRQWYFYRAPGSALERFRVSGDVVEILHEECGNGEDNNGDGIPDSGCGLGAAAGGCYLDGDCLSGTCEGAALDPDSVDAWVLGACEPSPEMGGCLADTDCGGGLTCFGADPDALEPGTCALGVLGAPCTADGQCESSFCDPFASQCRVAEGEACEASPECGTGFTCDEELCAPVDCGPLGSVVNGFVSAPTTTFGSVATYHCIGARVPYPEATRTCQVNGVWSGTAAACAVEPVTCSFSWHCPAEAWCAANTSERRCSPRPAYNGVMMPFQWIPAGTFMMGSPEEEHGRWSDEDQVSVTLTRDCWVQRTPVTQAQWEAVTSAWNARPDAQRTMSGWGGPTPTFGTQPSCYLADGTACSTSGSNPDRPVERVNWWDAVVFANALSIMEGLTPCYTLSGCGTGTGEGSMGGGCDGTTSSCGMDAFSCSATGFVGKICTGYRLLTEAEWERAARGETTTATYNGDLSGTVDTCIGSPPQPVLDSIAWWCGNSGNRTANVEGKTPNVWGLHDMLGNVQEWTWTRYATAHSGGIDPLGPPTGANNRVRRGGAWLNASQHVRAARRPASGTVGRNHNVGFRLARTAP